MLESWDCSNKNKTEKAFNHTGYAINDNYSKVKLPVTNLVAKKLSFSGLFYTTPGN